MSTTTTARIGVILAGGASRRLPGGKASAVLGGQTLLARATATVRLAGLTPVVCARTATDLPFVDAALWREAEHDGPPHPLRGIAAALDRAAEPVVVLPVDLPLLPADVVAALGAAPADRVLAHAGRAAALVARLSPSLAPRLRAAADAGAPALRTLLALGAAPVELGELTAVPAAQALLNVNSPEDLRTAERLLAGA